VLVLALLSGCAAAWAQEEPAVVRRATELREQPGDAGRSLAPLPVDTAVTRLPERQGPWVRVRTAAGAVGWVHLFDVGAPGASAASSGGGASGLLRGVTGFFSKSTPRSTVSTSTIGIRGLGAEDLAQAQPDMAAVARMESLRVSEQQARQFAREARWTPASVEPLPAPAAATSGAHPGGQQ
jgi:hypothetical protein